MSDAEGDKEQSRARKLVLSVGGVLATLLRLTPGKDSVAWDPGKARFIVNGHYVSIETVRRELRRFETAVGVKMRTLADALAKGDIDLEQWRRGMQDLVGSSHVVMAALATGTIAAAVKNETVQTAIVRERKFVDGFADDIEKKKLRPPTIAARAKSYLLAATITFGEVEQAVRQAAGYTEAIRVRTAEESCEGCIRWAGRWLPIGEMAVLGSLQCGNYCRCYLEYR